MMRCAAPRPIVSAVVLLLCNAVAPGLGNTTERDGGSPTTDLEDNKLEIESSLWEMPPTTSTDSIGHGVNNKTGHVRMESNFRDGPLDSTVSVSRTPSTAGLRHMVSKTDITTNNSYGEVTFSMISTLIPTSVSHVADDVGLNLASGTHNMTSSIINKTYPDHALGPTIPTVDPKDNTKTNATFTASIHPAMSKAEYWWPSSFLCIFIENAKGKVSQNTCKNNGRSVTVEFIERTCRLNTSAVGKVIGFASSSCLRLNVSDEALQRYAKNKTPGFKILVNGEFLDAKVVCVITSRTMSIDIKACPIRSSRARVMSVAMLRNYLVRTCQFPPKEVRSSDLIRVGDTLDECASGKKPRRLQRTLDTKGILPLVIAGLAVNVCSILSSLVRYVMVAPSSSSSSSVSSLPCNWYLILLLVTSTGQLATQLVHPLVQYGSLAQLGFVSSCVYLFVNCWTRLTTVLSTLALVGEPTRAVWQHPSHIQSTSFTLRQVKVSRDRGIFLEY